MYSERRKEGIMNKMRKTPTTTSHIQMSTNNINAMKAINATLEHIKMIVTVILLICMYVCACINGMYWIILHRNIKTKLYKKNTTLNNCENESSVTEKYKNCVVTFQVWMLWIQHPYFMAEMLSLSHTHTHVLQNGNILFFVHKADDPDDRSFCGLKKKSLN